jgi:ribosome-binding protein aMBF1 (putative translation factor)
MWEWPQAHVGGAAPCARLFIHFLDNLASRLALPRKGSRRVAKTIHSEGHEALCKALIDARKAAGMTQADLASRLRCHQSFVARIESGERRVDVVELVVLARALGVASAAVLEVVESATEAGHRI